MNIKVLGPGCAKCQSLEKTVKEVVSILQLDVTVEEVKDMKKIMQYPILMTPGLVINEKVVMSGKVPSRAEVEQLIMNALAMEDAEKK
ncbi:MAG: thioredoxin family protein [Dehalococcoidia bacterium]|nr:thioredoxin family protein [Dehalococcoidia bacterium]MDD5493973.1 thioredoxin family protein [Dehalococcoidia bacterium]